MCIKKEETHSLDGSTKDDGGEDEKGAPVSEAWTAGGISFDGIRHFCSLSFELCFCDKK